MASARILAVDDSPTILEMIKAILEAADYEVITAADGAEALETARAEKPDLILLDVMLPKLDGYRVCRLLKFDGGAGHGHRDPHRRQPVPDQARRAGYAPHRGRRGARPDSRVGACHEQPRIHVRDGAGLAGLDRRDHR